MTQSYVAIDIETTGLDVERDSITEIGAVRFGEDGSESESFETFINPGRQIPYFIEKLTGVTNEAVLGAPSIDEMREELERFVGDDPIVGQNVGFDIAFLRRAGVRLRPPMVIDTAHLGRLLLTNDGAAHGLPELASALGVEVSVHHRALPDARTAAGVFRALMARVAELPETRRLELARVTAMNDPALAGVIGGPGWELMPPREYTIPMPPPVPDWPALVRRETPLALTAEEVGRVFESGASGLSAFEDRPEQLAMADAVRAAMSDGGHYVIEAGTGVGKSLAYLVPAALHALRNGERVVISTNTINLQEQLYAKDVPALRRMLRAAGVIERDEDLRATVLKGRSNYLCMRRFVASYLSNLGDPDFGELAASLLLWLPTTTTGDRAELPLDRMDRNTWQRFSAQDTDCLAKQNRYVRDGNCFLQRARKAAESAHIVIVNHALLLADLASGGNALPSFDHLVIDEAHNLEDVATTQFGGSVGRRLLSEALEGLHRRGSREQREGGVAVLLKGFPDDSVKAAGRALESAAGNAQAALVPFFTDLARELPRGEDDRLLVTPAVRARETWTTVELGWAEVDRALREALSAANSAARAVGDAVAVEGSEALSGEVESACRRVDELRGFLGEVMKPTGEETIVWLAREGEQGGTRGQQAASFHAAPLDVGPRLWEELFAKRRTVVATSATLSANGSMDYTIRRLGLESPETLLLGSPYDYRNATLLTSFTDIPEPNDPGYIDAVCNALIELVRASEGRALALFTSHGAIRQVYPRIREALDDDGITVLAQGLDGTPRRLTDLLREQPRTLVLGTQSFWEGVDIRGDALSLLIIARLPFAVPTDPVYRARSEQYDNPFMQYALPSSILRFRQGFGRLIRDREDRGVVAVLDRRIWEKSYGARFVAALPDCTRLRGDTHDVAFSIREWLDR